MKLLIMKNKLENIYLKFLKIKDLLFQAKHFFERATELEREGKLYDGKKINNFDLK